jgi:hypothetical protein
MLVSIYSIVFGPYGYAAVAAWTPTFDTRGTCAVYRRRRHEHTPLYRTVQGHLETYLAPVSLRSPSWMSSVCFGYVRTLPAAASASRERSSKGEGCMVEP